MLICHTYSLTAEICECEIDVEVSRLVVKFLGDVERYTTNLIGASRSAPNRQGIIAIVANR